MRKTTKRLTKANRNMLRWPVSAIRSAGIKFFHKRSQIGRETIDNPGSWKILDRLYGNEPQRIETAAFRPVHWTDRMFHFSKAA